MRLSLILVLHCCLNLSLEAQQPRKTVIVSVGMGFSKFLIPMESRFASYSSASNIHFGLGYGIPIKKQLGLLSEIQWSQKGASIKYNNNLSNIDLSYLSLPLSVNFKQKNWQIGIGFEPSVKLYTRIGGPFLTEQVRRMISSTMPRRFEVNQFLNMGYQWKKLQISNRLGVGLTNLSNETRITDQSQAQRAHSLGRNLYYQFTLGYVFR